MGKQQLCRKCIYAATCSDYAITYPNSVIECEDYVEEKKKGDKDE